MRVFQFTLGVLAAAFLNGCAIADRMYYLPDHKLYGTPQQDGLKYEQITFPSADGTALAGWFVPATTPALGTVIHFHGNGANISGQFYFVRWLPKNGFNVFEFDYRGYGLSAGSPTRTGVYEDALAAVRYLKTRPDLDQTKIILFGQSLGAGLALRVAATKQFAGIVGMVEDSGFSTYSGVASDHYGLLGNLFVPYGDEPVDAAAKISPIPLLIIHGDADQVVPYYHAQRIFAAAHEPKELWTIPQGQHINALTEAHQAEYIPRLLEKFRTWVGSPPTHQNP